MEIQGTVVKAAIAPKLRTRESPTAEIDLEKSALCNLGQMTTAAAARKYDREDECAMTRIPDSAPMVLHLTDVAREAQRRVAEQELLLYELDHRFKNMLTMIVGLIRYQLHSIVDPDARSAMGVLGERVQAMGFVHQICSHAHTGDLAEVVASVCTNLVRTDPRFELKLQAERVIVSERTATVVALISNELVTNAMKHSLSDRAVGQIFVNLRPAGENAFVLSVSDDGAPLAVDVQTHLNGTGLKLITRLVRQLAGELRVEAAPKKRFSVIVPVHAAACG